MITKKPIEKMLEPTIEVAVPSVPVLLAAVSRSRSRENSLSMNNELL
jgi:hypothetical protein